MAGFIVSRKIAENKAVDGITFNVKRGETVGLVGESGCGKSTTGRAILQLYKPTAGSIHFEGKDMSSLHGEELRLTRRRMQMIFQDPYASLNPRMSLRDIVGEPLLIHKLGNAAERRERVAELMRIVGLNPYYATRFPHEFSGGQRQRIGVARALALDPQILIADEPVSALDVSVQAQVLELLADIRDRLDLSMIFITHDLRVAAQVCDSIAVMRLGEVVEYGPTAALFADPQHEYTRELLNSVPGKHWVAPKTID
jgi:oligopeptide transport system ATP-binding protein